MSKGRSIGERKRHKAGNWGKIRGPGAHNGTNEKRGRVPGPRKT